MGPGAQLEDTPYSRLGRNLAWLGRTMLAGALYDLVLGLLGLFSPSLVIRLMHLAAPGELFYFYFWPLLHLVFACFGVLAWMDVKRNVVIVTGAIIARTIYAFFMFVAVGALQARMAWAVLGGVSLLLAGGHYVFLRLSDFSFWEVLLRAGNPPAMWRR